MRTATRSALAAGVVIATLALSGCAGTVALPRAPDATNPLCASIVVGLPETVADLQQRETDAQGTSAWGDPAAVILRCGVPVPPPTAEFPCVSPEGIDWLRDDSEDPIFTFTTYGRDPAVQVRIDSAAVSGVAVLNELAFALSVVPQDGECISLEETESE